MATDKFGQQMVWDERLRRWVPRGSTTGGMPQILPERGTATGETGIGGGFRYGGGRGTRTAAPSLLARPTQPVNPWAPGGSMAPPGGYAPGMNYAFGAPTAGQPQLASVGSSYLETPDAYYKDANGMWQLRPSAAASINAWRTGLAGAGAQPTAPGTQPGPYGAGTQGPGGDMQYFQPPPYVGPEDLGGVPQWQEPTAGQPQYTAPAAPAANFYSFTGGDYDALQKMLFEQTMGPVREELGARGLLESSYYGQAAAEAAASALGQRMSLQAGEQARQTAFDQWQREQGFRESGAYNQWQQNERLRAWQEAEQRLRGQVTAYGTAQSESENRNQWLWNTYSMQHQDYWTQISTLLKSILMPYEAVPYSGLNYMVPMYL